MRIYNVEILDNIPPEQYFGMPGVSYSFIKNGGKKIDVTAKMRLGSAVDAYLFEPSTYDMYKFEQVRRLANHAATFLGDSLKHARRQVVVKCVMEWGGYWMLYKGRIDLLLPELVVDMKVSELNLLAAINHFGYDKQLSGYSLPLKCKKSIIFSINPKTNIVQTLPIPTRAEWWREQVIKYGQRI